MKQPETSRRLGAKESLAWNVITSGRLEQSTGTKMQGFEEIVWVMEEWEKGGKEESLWHSDAERRRLPRYLCERLCNVTSRFSLWQILG